jgi:hypothetical protein
MTDSVFLEGTGCECDVTLDTWLKDALPLTPGLVRAVAARELVLAAREFFERSYAWRVRMSNIAARTGDKEYWLSPYDEFSNVVAVLRVMFKPTDTNAYSQLAPIASPPLETDSTTNRPVVYYVSHPPDAIKLYPQLESNGLGTLAVDVALTPKQSVEHLPRIAAIKFYDAILNGYLSRVLLHPNKPYSNLILAGEHRRRFMSEIGRWRSEADTGFNGTQNWVFPGGWNVARH